jgi:hypothetical protein
MGRSLALVFAPICPRPPKAARGERPAGRDGTPLSSQLSSSRIPHRFSNSALRHYVEGVHGIQTDTGTLFHPNSVQNEHETFGDRPRAPLPLGVDNRLCGDEGWLKKGLRFFGAARRGKPS